MLESPYLLQIHTEYLEMKWDLWDLSKDLVGRRKWADQTNRPGTDKG